MSYAASPTPPTRLLLRQPLPGAGQCFMLAVMLLMALGLALLFSATAADGFARRGEPFSHLFSQLKGVALGGVGLCVAAFVHPRFWVRISPLLLLIVILALLALFVPGLGLERNQATRWLRMGFMDFQPSELVKIVIPLTLAWCVTLFGEAGPGDSTLRGTLVRVLYRLAQVSVVGAVATLVAVEPDYGTALFVLCVSGVLLLASGMPWIYPLLAAIPAIPAGWFLFLKREEEILERMQGLLDPEKVFQVQRSLFGIGSGGMTGKGLGRGTESYFLPEQQTDFIFAILGEEMGFVGVVLLLILFTLLLQSGWKITRRCQDPALRLVAFAITLNLVLQACINVAVATASAPTKGISLPFVSFGSSGLTVSLFQAGLLLGIARVSATPGTPNASSTSDDESTPPRAPVSAAEGVS